MFPDPITLTVTGLILGGFIVRKDNVEAQSFILFAIAAIEIIIATSFLLWLEYEDWAKEKYKRYYVRFLRARNKFPGRTWAGIRFEEYYGKKLKTATVKATSDRSQAMSIEDFDEDYINMIKRVKELIEEYGDQ